MDDHARGVIGICFAGGLQKRGVVTPEPEVTFDPLVGSPSICRFELSFGTNPFKVSPNQSLRLLSSARCFFPTILTGLELLSPMGPVCKCRWLLPDQSAQR